MRARLQLYDYDETIDIAEGATDATFRLRLEQTGPTQLEAWFLDADGAMQGAYYVYVERVAAL